MNTAFGYSLDELSPDVKVFKKIIAASSVSLAETENYYEQTSKLFHVLGKDQNHIFKGANLAYLKIQNLSTQADLLGKTDYDMHYREVNKTPATFQQEDKACMNGTFTKDCYGAIFPISDTMPILLQSKKIPILSNQKPIGVLAAGFDVTQAFLNLKTLVANEVIAPTKLTKHDKLSPKELQTLRLYNQGLPRKTAAQKLKISESTYAWYLREIRLKFAITTRAEMLILEQHFI